MTNGIRLQNGQNANDQFHPVGNSLMNNSLNNGLNQSKGSVFGKDAGGKFYEPIGWQHPQYEI